MPVSGITIAPVNFDSVMVALKKLTPALQGAVREAVTNSIPFAEKEVVDQILARYDISRANLFKNSRNGKWKMVPKYPTQSNLNGSIKVTGTRMPVMRFSVSPSTVPNQKGIPVAARTPVTVRITKKGGIQSGKPNVFLAKMKSGHIGVYRRKIPNPGGPRRLRPDKQWTQLPISEEYMLSVPEMLASKEIRQIYEPRLSKYFQDEFMKGLRKIPLSTWWQSAATLKKMGFI